MGCAASTSGDDVDSQDRKHGNNDEADDSVSATSKHRDSLAGEDAAADAAASSNPSDSKKTVVTAREARRAAAALEKRIELFRPLALIKVGQALKSAVGKWRQPNPADPMDVLYCAQILVKLRNKCGVVRNDGTFLQEGLDQLPRVVQMAVDRGGASAPNTTTDGVPCDTEFDLTRTVATACGMPLDTVTTWVDRVVTAADCLIVAATNSCELPASMASSSDHKPERRSGDLPKAVQRTLQQLFKAAPDTWDEIASVTGADPDDLLSIADSICEDFVVPANLSSRTLTRACALRSLVRTARSVVLLFHGGRPNSSPVASTNSRLHLQGLESKALSSLVVHIWRYCAHPSGGMELSRKVDAALQSMGALLAFLGAVPAHKAALDGYAAMAPYLLGPMLDAKATLILLYCQAIVQAQLKLDVPDIERHAILDATVAALDRSPVFRAMKEGESLSSKVNPTFMHEAGEGHGPRKEFFDQCAAALSSLTSAPQPLRGQALASGGEGSSLLWVRAVDPSARDMLKGLLVAGNTIQILLPSAPGESSSNIPGATGAHADDMVGDLDTREPFEARIFSARDSDGDLGLRLAAVLPCDVDDVPVLAAKRHHFQCMCRPSPDAQFMWFNEAVSDQVSAQAGSYYKVLGWLLGAALANGVAFPLPLPSVIFKLLRQSLLGMPFTVAEWDLIELDPSYKDTLARMRALGVEEFNEYALSLMDDDDDNADKFTRATKDTLDAVREQFIADQMIAEVLVRRCKKRLRLTASGFAAAMVPMLPAAWAVASTTLRDAICGAPDSVDQDFDFVDMFSVSVSEDYNETAHGKVFVRMLHDAMDGKFVGGGPDRRVRFKRRLLQFITGRNLLPGSKGTETISVEYPEYAESVAEYATLVGRLPSSHTCSNTLQVPNYLEGLMFGASGEACEAILGPSPQLTTRITPDARREGWSRLSEPLQLSLMEQARVLLNERLTASAFGADTYELDEQSDDDDDDDDDSGDDRRRQSSMMRGIPAPKRTNTAPPDQLMSVAAYLESKRLPGRASPMVLLASSFNSSAASSSSSQQRGKTRKVAAAHVLRPSNNDNDNNPGGHRSPQNFNHIAADDDDDNFDDYEMPAEDAPQGFDGGGEPVDAEGGPARVSNPFAIPDSYSSSGDETPVTRASTRPDIRFQTGLAPDGIDYSKPDMVVNAADFEDSDDDGPVEPPYEPTAATVAMGGAPSTTLPGQMHDFDS